MRPLRALASHRAFAALLLACALVMRVVVPSGYMPGAGSASHFTIAICDGTSAASATLTLPERAHNTPTGHAASSCPYAVLSLAMMGGAGQPFVAEVLPAGSAPPRALTRVNRVSAPTGLPPSQAPPATA